MGPIDWKVVGKLGIPTVFAGVLLYFVLSVIHSELHEQTKTGADTNRLIQLHLEDSSNKFNEIRANEHALVSIVTQLCINQGKSNTERALCVEAADRK